MGTYEQVLNGLIRFIGTEIITQLTGNSKLLLGIGVGWPEKRRKYMEEYVVSKKDFEKYLNNNLQIDYEMWIEYKKSLA